VTQRKPGQGGEVATSQLQLVPGQAHPQRCAWQGASRGWPRQPSLRLARLLNFRSAGAADRAESLDARNGAYYSYTVYVLSRRQDEAFARHGASPSDVACGLGGQIVERRLAQAKPSGTRVHEVSPLLRTPASTV
jgi:hypothetical protein